MSTPLETALAASKPIDDAPRQPLEVELLVSDHQRRCLITDEIGRDEIDMQPEGEL